MIWTALAVLGPCAAALAGFLFVRTRLNDGDVPVAASLFPPGAPLRAMAIWAHPDDEITSAGTFAAMTAAGADLVLVYLTAGEAARDTGYSRQELAQVRRREAQAAGALLGASQVEVLDFPDGGLPAADAAAAKTAIAALIDRHAPSVIVSFDETVGFYGHPDHVLAHQLSRAVATALGLPFWEIVSAPEDAEAQSEDQVETHDIAPWLDRKRAALRAYATQLTVDGEEIVHVGGQRQAIETIELFRLRALE